MQPQTRRYILFGIAIIAGIVAGMIFGWEILPLISNDTDPHSLRIDFKTDYVLMVAELHHLEGDTFTALTRLMVLEYDDPESLLQNTIAYAQANHYAPGDLAQMLNLSSAIQSLPAIAE